MLRNQMLGNSIADVVHIRQNGICVFLQGSLIGQIYITQRRIAHFVFVLLLHDRLPDVLKLGQEKTGGLGIAAGRGGLYPGILIHAGADAFVNGPVFKWQVVVVFIVRIEML